MNNNDVALVKLSAENLVLRQRLALLDRENRRLRKTIDTRNQIIDRVTVRIKGEKK